MIKKKNIQLQEIILDGRTINSPWGDTTICIENRPLQNKKAMDILNGVLSLKSVSENEYIAIEFQTVGLKNARIRKILNTFLFEKRLCRNNFLSIIDPLKQIEKMSILHLIQDIFLEINENSKSHVFTIFDRDVKSFLNYKKNLFKKCKIRIALSTHISEEQLLTIAQFVALICNNNFDIILIKKYFYETECAICYDNMIYYISEDNIDISPKKLVSILNCGHMFCSGCESKIKICPLCQKPKHLNQPQLLKYNYENNMQKYCNRISVFKLISCHKMLIFALIFCICAFLIFRFSKRHPVAFFQTVDIWKPRIFLALKWIFTFLVFLVFVFGIIFVIITIIINLSEDGNNGQNFLTDFFELLISPRSSDLNIMESIFKNATNATNSTFY